jgi:release factor glutamine methyltransferase
MLADCLAAEQLGPAASVLDLCTGSGLLAVAAASMGASEVVALDISRRSVLAARINARLNGVEVDAVRSDLFSALEGRRFDVIVSNPPYVPGQGAALPRRGASRAWEAGPRGRALIDRICVTAPAHLNPGGSLLLVHSSVCGERETVEALRAGGLATSVVARHRGPLGPLMRARAAWLHRRGVLPDPGTEELLVIRAQRTASSAAPTASTSGG